MHCPEIAKRNFFRFLFNGSFFIEIRDEGVGIPEESKNRIFETKIPCL